MRNYSFTHDDKNYTLTANFAAAEAISKNVADPLMMTRESALEKFMLDQGYPYEPKFSFDVSSIAAIIWTGLKATAKIEDATSPTIEEAQELVFDMGFLTAAQHVGQYIGLLVEPTDSPHRVQFTPAEQGETPKKP